MNPAAVAALQAATTDEVFLPLMTITYPNGIVSRIVANTEALDSRGHTFVAWPFTLNLPNQADSSANAATVVFDNVDAAMWQALRQQVEVVTIMLEIIMASDPNTPLIVVDHLRLRGATATPLAITCQLAVDSIWTIGYPANDYTPSQYPGIFNNA